MDGWITTTDISNVAFEVLDVDNVEADGGLPILAIRSGFESCGYILCTV